jgi:hypothetical protein
MCAAPALIIALLDLKHSGEANRYREEANEERARANEALSRIAEHTKKPPSKAERIAAILSRHLRETAKVVNADDSQWPSPAEIVEVKNDIVALFTPAGPTSSSASAIYAPCDRVEIIEGTGGSLTLKVLERYGTAQNLGQIKKWEERENAHVAPSFPKGPNVFNIEYSKPGSADRRRLDVFESADGKNAYMLVSSNGELFVGDNVVISRHFLLAQLDLETQGFRHSSSGSGGNKYPLFIKTKS